MLMMLLIVAEGKTNATACWCQLKRMQPESVEESDDGTNGQSDRQSQSKSNAKHTTYYATSKLSLLLSLSLAKCVCNVP